MNNIAALILKYLPYLIQASTSVPEIVGFIGEIKRIFARDKIWTPEQEAEFDAKVEHLKDDPYWQVRD